MKLFKRLLAVALAGVLALTVLTGCGGVNQKELAAILGDMDGVTYKNMGEEEANKVFDAIQKAYPGLSEAEQENFHVGYVQDAVKTALGIQNGTKDLYRVSFAKMEKFSSEYLKQHDVYALAQLVQRNSVELRDRYTLYRLSNQGAISMKSVQFNGAEYLVVVTKQLA